MRVCIVCAAVVWLTALHGVVPGARYAIYRDFHNGVPLVHVGEAVVLEPAEQTSKVAITRVVDPIQPGDIAGPRRKR